MKRTIRLFVQRHGAHSDGKLTAEGKAQVARAAKEHLAGFTFDDFMSSEMPRAQETVSVAAEAIGQSASGITQDEGFGFSFAEELPLEAETPYDAFLEAVSKEHDAGRPVTVDFTFKHWKPSQVVAAVLHNTMRLMAESLDSEQPTNRELNVLVGSHATCSLATLNPSNTEGAPNNGDIMVYTWEVENGKATLAASRFLPAPKGD